MCVFHHTSVCSYSDGWAWQQELVQARVRKEQPDERDVLLLLQHSPVYTLGRRATPEHLRFDPSEDPTVELYRTERG